MNYHAALEEAPVKLRCTARLKALTCSLEYDHKHGHVFVAGSYVEPIHEDCA